MVQEHWYIEKDLQLFQSVVGNIQVYGVSGMNDNYTLLIVRPFIGDFNTDFERAASLHSHAQVNLLLELPRSLNCVTRLLKPIWIYCIRIKISLLVQNQQFITLLFRKNKRVQCYIGICLYTWSWWSFVGPRANKLDMPIQYSRCYVKRAQWDKATEHDIEK